MDSEKSEPPSPAGAGLRRARVVPGAFVAQGGVKALGLASTPWIARGLGRMGRVRAAIGPGFLFLCGDTGTSKAKPRAERVVHPPHFMRANAACVASRQSPGL